MGGMLGRGPGGLGEVCVGAGEGMLEEGLLASDKWRLPVAKSPVGVGVIGPNSPPSFCRTAGRNGYNASTRAVNGDLWSLRSRALLLCSSQHAVSGNVCGVDTGPHGRALQNWPNRIARKAVGQARPWRSTPRKMELLLTPAAFNHPRAQRSCRTGFLILAEGNCHFAADALLASFRVRNIDHEAVVREGEISHANGCELRPTEGACKPDQNQNAVPQAK